jgi:hypothetical protein
MIEAVNATGKGRLVMTQIAPIDNQSIVRIASAGTFFLTPAGASVTGAQMVGSLVAITKEKGPTAIKYAAILRTRGIAGLIETLNAKANMLAADHRDRRR